MKRENLQTAYGIASFLPGVDKIKRYIFKKGTGGTDSARYCYSVWLRHLKMANTNGLNSCPKVVVELGPGDSLGIGLAALLSGSEKYLAFDIFKHANTENNLLIFDELVILFNDRTPIPRDEEFPAVKPSLGDKYSFPDHILDQNRLQNALEKNRLDRIRKSIISFNNDPIIQYKVQRTADINFSQESADMIISQAVLAHVEDLNSLYKTFYSWLKPGAYMSNVIDFGSHGITDDWNGHWKIPDFKWKLIRGKRPYLLNREPHSTHIAMIKEAGFEIVCDLKTELKTNITKAELASRFSTITDDDLIIRNAFIQAVKNPDRG